MAEERKEFARDVYLHLEGTDGAFRMPATPPKSSTDEVVGALKTLDELQRYIYDWAETKGWNKDLKDRSFGDWCQLIGGEINEAYEDYRAHHDVADVYYQSSEDPRTNYTFEEMEKFSKTGAYPSGYFKPCGIPIEFADCVIRILHFFAANKMNLALYLMMKMEYNETRTYRHGGKKV